MHFIAPEVLCIVSWQRSIGVRLDFIRRFGQDHNLISSKLNVHSCSVSLFFTVYYSLLLPPEKPSKLVKGCYVHLSQPKEPQLALHVNYTSCLFFLLGSSWEVCIRFQSTKLENTGICKPNGMTFINRTNLGFLGSSSGLWLRLSMERWQSGLSSACACICRKISYLDLTHLDIYKL